MTKQEHFDQKFKDKKVLILGFGREGKSTLSILNKYLPSLKVDIADKKDSDSYLDNLTKYDIVIKSPGIPNKLLEIKNAISKGVVFTSQTEIFFDLVEGIIIGVTGTKGKSTTTSLIYHILKNEKKKVFLVGNLGVPVFDYLDSDTKDAIFCFELSSHQLLNLKKSPHIAAFLNIYEEHLDYYEDYKDYFNAKTNIAKYQTEDDYFVYNSDFELINSFAKELKSKKLDINSFDLPEIKTKLLGGHNLNNIKVAWLVTKELGIEEDKIRSGIESFKPLEDRLELVRSLNNIDFVNDTLATIPEATISAVESFSNYENITLILGGFDRGIDFSNLGNNLSNNKNIKNIILIGQTAKLIEGSLKEFKGVLSKLDDVDMFEVVNLAYEVTKPKGLVLLSPASTSFDMFKDYKDRGNQFKEAVNHLK